MPKRKANWWPPSILSDPDVLSVDDEGRFVLCKICHVHYAVHGGKKPKPVIMNSNFRTRAWDVHKERTNSHRLQKRLQQAQGQQTTDTKAQQQQQEQQPEEPQQSTQQKQPEQQQMQGQPPGQSQTQSQSQSMPALATQAQTPTQAPPRQVQGKTPAPLTQRQAQHHSPPRVSQQSQFKTQALQQQRRRLQQQQDLEETKDAGHEALQVPTRNSATERPVSAAPESITAAPTSRDRTHGSEMMNSTAGKRPASTVPDDAPAQRRRVFREGSPGSLPAESEVARRATAHAYERHSLTVPGPGNNAKKAVPSEHAVAMEQQADSSARWRHMHDDVSRALNAAPRRRQQGPTSYTSGELRAAKTLAQTETGDLGSNNSERVAKKLRSLNAEYHASNMRHADAYNMRHSEAFDRRSAGYKEYWGTLRDVYTSSGTTIGGSGGSGNAVAHRKSLLRSGSPSVKQTTRVESKEAEADSTTPDESGSSEDAFKPAVVVHDASLIYAIERLTDATSKQIADLYEKQTADTKDTLAGLTSVMTDLRVQHGNAIGRIIELQEKHLKVMESILEVKLRKEAARNGKNSFGSNGSTTASSSGSSPDSSASGVSGLSNQVAEGDQP